jgi:LysR family glycine cleavage system transcriptional activator
MKLPPLKSLSFFLAAAHHHSFKKASQELNVTQAAVSQQIRLLEENLQCQLFNRESKQTSLTAAGLQLLPFVEKAFSQLSQGVNLLASEPEPNTLNITSLHSLTSLVLIPKIQSFQNKHPEITLQFSPTNQLVNFEDGAADVAIRRGLGSYPGLESKQLVDEQVVFVANASLFNSSTPSIKELLATPLLIDVSSDLKPAFEKFCDQYNINQDDFTVGLQTTDSGPVLEKTMAGQGIAFVSKSLVFEQLKRGTLINLFDFIDTSPISLYLVAPPHHFQWKKVQKLEAWLRTIFEQPSL